MNKGEGGNNHKMANFKIINLIIESRQVIDAYKE